MIARSQTDLLLDVHDLSVSFAIQGHRTEVLKDVSFSVRPGEILGVLGESGSGKSVTASAIMGLVSEPGRIERGRILYRGRDIVDLPPNERRSLCGASLAMVFQDALAALNPLYPVGWQIAEMFAIHGRAPRREAQRRAIELMAQVGIPDAQSRSELYPHQFSGGMRQRVVIAMAIALTPDLIIADEPTTALDVTVQAQVIDLLKMIRDQNGSSIIMITHDLGVIAECADRVVVMYAGRIVEATAIEDLFDRPAHPYTEGLLRSRPRLFGDDEALLPIPGTPPNPALPMIGCAFAARCPYAFDRCRTDNPQLIESRNGGLVACHRPGVHQEAHR